MPSKRRNLARVIAVMLVAALASVTIPATSTDAQPPKVCTLVGCAGGVSLDFGTLHSRFPQARTVTLCVVDHCARRLVAPMGNPTSLVTIGAGGGGPYNVLVVVRDRNHRTILRTT